jgi:hypothetical protein
MTSSLFAIVCGGFFIFVFFAAGIAAIIFGYRNRQKATESQNWPEVVGTITRVEVRKDTDTDAEGFTTTSFVPEIEYQYQINDEVYTSEKFSFGSTQTFNSRKKAEEALNQYPLNGSLPVYYNPQEPNEAVLVQGTKGTLTLIIAGIVFVAISICGSCIGLYLIFSNL